MRYNVIFTLLAVLCLVSCSPAEAPVQEPAIDEGTETLTVFVVDVDDQPLPKVEVYVNDILQGFTREFGQTKGTRTFLLTEEINNVYVQKEGYETSEEIAIHRNGHQQARFVLGRSTTTVSIVVPDKLSDVVVSLQQIDSPIIQSTVITDQSGKAVFEKVPDGDYFVTLVKQDYEEGQAKITVNYTTHGPELEEQISLQSNPFLLVNVFDEHKNRIPEAEVALFTRKEYNTPGILPSKTRITGTSGEAMFRNLIFGEQYIIVVKREGFTARIIEKLLEEGDNSLKAEMEESRE